LRQYFSGYHRITVPYEHVASFIDELFKEGISYRVSKRKNKDGYLLFLSKKDVKALTQKNAAFFENCSVSEQFGFFRVLAKCKQRPGVPLGILLGTLLFVFLSCFVWEVRIEGLEGYNKDAVLSELEALGLCEGAFLPKTDLDAISAAFLTKSELVGWMNITKKGTVVFVSCRPYTVGELPPQDKVGVGANLVASKDAIIEEIAVKEGRVTVQKGEVIKEGDLLVSGIYEHALGSKIVYAKGEVKGRVQKTLTVFVPYESVVNRYTESRLERLEISVLGRTLCLFSRKNKAAGSLIESENRLYLFDRIRLPVTVKRQKSYQSEPQTVRISEADAVKAAYAKMKTETALLLRDGELLQKNVRAEFGESGYTLIYELLYCENIAQTIEFSVK
ncbi:MAG: sporulation protein YqfD, partial [Clostridia bacterium]|nr:sporulation protein YqfD [Clostridia bacterium]